MILGVDPGMAACGWALVTPDGRLCRHGCVRTVPHKGTGSAQARLGEIAEALLPVMTRALLAAVEWPGGGFGRDAGAAAKTSAAAGLVVGIAMGARLAVLTPAPVTWRRAFGAAAGQDDAIHAELAQRYRKELDGTKRGDLPHVLDAVGIALWANQQEDA